MSAKSDKEVAALRKWIRTHDPEYLEKRKAYNSDVRVKEKRKINSKRRRLASCALMTLIKKSKNCTIDGKNYTIKRGRIIENDKDNSFVVRADKKGNLYRMEYTNEDELDDEKYDLALEEGERAKLFKAVKRLFDGDPNLESAVCRKSVIEIKEVPVEELYWKNLSDEEKHRLLDKLSK